MPSCATCIARNLLITNDIVKFFERFLVARGYYHLLTDQFGDVFDTERSAWSYRQVNETAPTHPAMRRWEWRAGSPKKRPR